MDFRPRMSLSSGETSKPIDEQLQHFPPIIYTLFAVYVPSFIASFLKARYDVQDAGLINTEKLLLNKQPQSDQKNLTHSKNVDKDRTVICKRLTKPWQIILTGLPSTRSTLLSLSTFSVNLALVFGVTDLVFRAKLFHPAEDLSFARIGYISVTEANLVVRESNSSRLPIHVSYRPINPATTHQDSPWKSAGSVTSLGNDTDFTGVVTFPLPGYPEQRYQWITSNNHSGFFTAPPKEGEVTRNGDFTFLTSSCIKARFPYNPMKHPLSIPGFRHMSRILKDAPGVQFMLFLGDFIYIDVPKRFGTSVEDYRREYRQVYASPDWPLVGQNLSWIHVLDDHEISNDWDSRTTGVYKAAVDPWHHYQTAVNPPRVTRARIGGSLQNNATYFQFTQGPTSFFLLDTRTYRDSSAALPVNSTEKTMLGSDQLFDLLEFLRKPEPEGVKWKIVISSVPFTKNWRVNSLDTWAGYLHERRIVLEAMWDVGLRGGVGVVVLSGDRHEFAATAFPPPAYGKWPSSATVNEFSVSPMSQFYLPIPTYKQTDHEDVEVKYVFLLHPEAKTSN